MKKLLWATSPVVVALLLAVGLFAGISSQVKAQDNLGDGAQSNTEMQTISSEYTQLSLPKEDVYVDVSPAYGQEQVTTTIYTSDAYSTTEFVTHICWEDRLGVCIYKQRFHHWPGTENVRTWKVSSADVWAVSFKFWILGVESPEDELVVEQPIPNRFFEERLFAPYLSR